MTPPRKVWIVGAPWKIEHVDEIMLAPDERAIYGETDADQFSIRLYTGCHIEHQRAALWHELQHAVFKTIGRAHSPLEEECILRSEVGAMSIFRDRRNKPLLLWLVPWLGD